MADASMPAAVRRRIEKIVPKPRQIALRPGVFAWSGQPLLAAGADPDVAYAAELFERACAGRAGCAPPRAARDAQEALSAQFVFGQRDRLPMTAELLNSVRAAQPAYLGDEGYCLEITPERVLAVADTAAGVYYAVQTLIALLPEDGAGQQAELPCMTVVDAPEAGLRAVQLDLGRGQVPTLAALQRTVERLGALKMNALFLYLEDAFCYSRHPRIGQHRDRLTPSEVHELRSFAQLHHVRIIPVMEAVGHMEAMLAVPGYEHLREGEGPRERDVVNAAHPQAVEFLEDLIADVCAAFADPLFFAGTDESFGLGMGASAQTARMLTRGGLFVGHIKRLREALARHGKRMAMWTDQLEPDFFKLFGIESFPLEYVSRVPRDVVMASWHYGRTDEFPYGDKLRELGFEQILWGALAHDLRLFPSVQETAQNAFSYMAHVHRLGAMGGCASQWDAPGDCRFTDNDWPCVAVFAEALWTRSPRAAAELLPAFLRNFYGEAGADLAEAHLTLGRIDAAIPWGWGNLYPPSGAQYFRPLEPHRLDAGQKQDVAALREEILQATADLRETAPRIARNRELLDFFRLALDQTATLTRLIDARCLLAEGGGGIDAAARRALREQLAAQKEEFGRLWSLGRKPRGLAANLERFERVIASV